MSFREINHKNNEEYWERLELVMERIEAVSEEEASGVEELYRDISLKCRNCLSSYTSWQKRP